jgi:hypothetical protein
MIQWLNEITDMHRIWCNGNSDIDSFIFKDPLGRIWTGSATAPHIELESSYTLSSCWINYEKKIVANFSGVLAGPFETLEETFMTYFFIKDKENEKAAQSNR